MRGTLRPNLFVWLFVFLIVWAAFCPLQAFAERKNDKIYDNWRTFIYSSPDQEFPPIYETSTFDIKTNTVFLHIMTSRGRCKTTDALISYTFTTPAQKEYYNNSIAGEIRVDQNPIHTTVSLLAIKNGGTKGTFTLHTIGDPQSLIEEMASGQIIRFRFKVGEAEYYYRFSLKGFQPSYARVMELCPKSGLGQEHKSAKPKPEGSTKTAPQKKDADFFPGAPPTDKKSSMPEKGFF